MIKSEACQTSSLQTGQIRQVTATELTNAIKMARGSGSAKAVIIADAGPTSHHRSD